MPSLFYTQTLNRLLLSKRRHMGQSCNEDFTNKTQRVEQKVKANGSVTVTTMMHSRREPVHDKMGFRWH